ncbi:4-galactosyl-N-acetylglucosaminide 3-alpha-L-fucosyltransferase 9-like [Diadema antillarum]|uniref:4-galactosyl-N-acetylglucosaminide 3-alpha-L-fucosyltransferase 9-like n=1 Tax=Diadema antillarum TaxID=105358 RepID=UPI003A84361B
MVMNRRTLAVFILLTLLLWVVELAFQSGFTRGVTKTCSSSEDKLWKLKNQTMRVKDLTSNYSRMSNFSEHARSSLGYQRDGLSSRDFNTTVASRRANDLPFNYRRYSNFLEHARSFLQYQQEGIPSRDLNTTDASRKDHYPSVTNFIVPKASAKLQCVRQVHVWSNNRVEDTGDYPCPGLSCGIRLVVDTRVDHLRRSHAVIPRSLSGWNWRDMLRVRPPGQKWIFLSHESPANTMRDIVPPRDLSGNRTYDYFMTYRSRESHLYGMFGFFDPNRPSIAENISVNWAAGRTRQVAWLASKCNAPSNRWNRHSFVRELAKRLDVGMFGKCGNRQEGCPYGKDSQKCKTVLRNFKFYLALENSACRDYITEKLWNNAYLQDLVPVVFGPPREDYERVAPPNSFIHVQDFKSIRELANYIILLDKRDDLYNRYFEWKQIGSVYLTTERWLLRPAQLCQVVAKLLDDEAAEEAGTYQAEALPDFGSWWTNSCLRVPKFPIEV